MEGFSSDGMIMARMRAPRLSCQQFDVLIEFMAAHPHFAAGRAGGSPGLTTREEHELLWRRLTAKLNAAIGPTKSTHKWQKCWVDLKSNARGRIAKIRSAMLNPALERTTPALTQWDHRVLSLMGPGYSDILSLYKDRLIRKTNQTKRTVSERLATSGAVSTDMNSNSSYSDQEQRLLQHLENSQHSSLVSEQSEQNSRSPHMNLSGVKREVIDESEEIMYEEDDVHDVECDVEEVEYVADLEDEFIPTENGDDHTGTDRHGSAAPPVISPSVTVSKVPAPMVSSSTSLGPQSVEASFSDLQLPLVNRRKRKLPDGRDDDESFEKFPKGTADILERLAVAAEESNAIQRDVADALNRLSDSFAQFVPLLTQLTANVSNQRK